MQTASQSPTDFDFVQDPYPFYEDMRADDPDFFFWKEYDIACCLSYDGVGAILKDRRFGTEAPAGHEPARPDHQTGFWAVEEHSLLALEPPRHTRLRGLILRAFTSRRIGELEPEITALCHQLVDNLSPEPDLLAEYAQKIPVIIIARLLGVPEDRCDDLLIWSHDMVGMYQAGRTVQMETRAAEAASSFAGFMREYVEYRRARPADDLITHLIGAEEDGEKLSTDELITTCILLLNAGHEATVHSIGNAIRTLLKTNTPLSVLGPDQVDATLEETIRFDPPLHMFERWAYERVEVQGQVFEAGQKVACLLAAANRDPSRWENPGLFDPGRKIQTNASFGAGVHFCIGAPLARLEMRVALPVFFNRCSRANILQDPVYAGKFHFHGLESLRVSLD